MSEKYTKLAEDIVFSSLWAKDGDTCKLWVTLIAIKDRDGVVDKNMSGISRLSGIPIEKCREAFELFMAPDPESTSTEFEGRKLIPLPNGGWQVVTHDKYEEYGWSEEKKLSERERKARYRASKKQTPEPCPDLSDPVKTPTKIIELVFPDKLSTPRFKEKWEQWVEFRKAGKKVKNWNALFSEQLNWLAKYSEDDAIESMSASIRNGWTGLFEPKANGFNKAKAPAQRWGKVQL